MYLLVMSITFECPNIVNLNICLSEMLKIFSTSVQLLEPLQPETVHVPTYKYNITCRYYYVIIGTIDRNTLLVLVSAVHFQNVWKNQFTDTKQASFYLTPTNYIDVQMMHKTDIFLYFKDDINKFSAIEIPYQVCSLHRAVIFKNNVPFIFRHSLNLILELFLSKNSM